MATIEFSCPVTGLQAFVNGDHCRRAIHDKIHWAAYECRHCHWWHIGPREMCPETGKRGYLSEQACDRDIEAAWTDPEWGARLHGRMPRRSYQCRHCGLWHMSTRSLSHEELSATGHVDPGLQPPEQSATIVV